MTIYIDVRYGSNKSKDFEIECEEQKYEFEVIMDSENEIDYISKFPKSNYINRPMTLGYLLNSSGEDYTIYCEGRYRRTFEESRKAPISNIAITIYCDKWIADDDPETYCYPWGAGNSLALISISVDGKTIANTSVRIPTGYGYKTIYTLPLNTPISKCNNIKIECNIIFVFDGFEHI